MSKLLPLFTNLISHKVKKKRENEGKAAGNEREVGGRGEGERERPGFRLSRKFVQFSEQLNSEYPQARVSAFIMELVHQSSKAN